RRGDDDRIERALLPHQRVEEPLWQAVLVLEDLDPRGEGRGIEALPGPALARRGGAEERLEVDRVDADPVAALRPGELAVKPAEGLALAVAVGSGGLPLARGEAALGVAVEAQRGEQRGSRREPEGEGA